MKHVGIALLVLIAAVGELRAQTVDLLLADAAAAAKSNRSKDAAKALGRAAAMTHKANDLLAEQMVGTQLVALLQPLDGTSLAEALAEVLSGLDAKRAGAFVSARALAGELLMLATRSGSTAHAPEASKALSAQSGALKSGKEARHLASYAKGLELVSLGKAAEAIAPLELALKGAAEEGWTDVALHVGTELAAQALAGGDSGKASESLATVATLIKPDTSPDLVQTWRNAVRTRLKGAPADVLVPFEAAVKPFGEKTKTGSSVNNPGNRLGNLSKVGRAWDRMSPTQAIVTVKRLDDGFEVTPSYAPDLKAKQRLASAFTHHTEGGLGLGFRERGVALLLIDFEGTRHPAASNAVPPGTALYRLARGESWVVGRNGVVRISG
jgi:hypothetical protein